MTAGASNRTVMPNMVIAVMTKEDCSYCFCGWFCLPQAIQSWAIAATIP